MLAAEAVRLAAIEALCPTSAVLANAGYPTLAGRAVYDSRAVALQDLDLEKAYTPVLSLYTSQSSASLRGEMAAADDTIATAVLDVVAELSVVADDGDGQLADAMAGDDPDARLVLAALCAQVRFVLERSQAGAIFRRVVARVIKVDQETFAVPNLGMRWQRVMMQFHCEIRDDQFDMMAGGLPEPIASLRAALPAGSYAAAKLDELAGHFAAEPTTPLEGVDVHHGEGSSLPGFTFDPGA